MKEIIPALGIPLFPKGLLTYNIRCPQCARADETHLNIHLKKNVFRCRKCGVSGGVFDFYALVTGTPRKRVYKCLQKKRHPAGKE